MEKRFDLDEFSLLFLLSIVLVLAVFVILIYKYGL